MLAEHFPDSLWKRNSRKSTFTILYSSGPSGRDCHHCPGPTHSSQHYMLWCGIIMRLLHDHALDFSVRYEEGFIADSSLLIRVGIYHGAELLRSLTSIPFPLTRPSNHVELSVPRASSLPYQSASTGQRLAFQFG
jgi:hypothetical protein